MEAVPIEAKWVLTIIAGFFLIFGLAALSGSWVTGVWHTRYTVSDFIGLDGVGATIIGIILTLIGIGGLVWIWLA